MSKFQLTETSVKNSNKIFKWIITLCRLTLEKSSAVRSRKLFEMLPGLCVSSALLCIMVFKLSVLQQPDLYCKHAILCCTQTIYYLKKIHRSSNAKQLSRRSTTQTARIDFSCLFNISTNPFFSELSEKKKHKSWLSNVPIDISKYCYLQNVIFTVLTIAALNR